MAHLEKTFRRFAAYHTTGQLMARCSAVNRLPTYLMTGRLLPAKNAQDIRYLPTYIAH